MQFVDSIRSRALSRLRSGLEDEDPAAQLSRPLPEKRLRETDMVIRFEYGHSFNGMTIFFFGTAYGNAPQQVRRVGDYMSLHSSILHFLSSDCHATPGFGRFGA